MNNSFDFDTEKYVQNRAYYEQRAHEMRAEALAEMASTAGKWVASKFDNLMVGLHMRAAH